MKTKMIWFLSLGLLLPSFGQAADSRPSDRGSGLPERYVAVYGGVNLPKRFHDPKSVIAGTDVFTELDDIQLKTSPVYGVKIAPFPTRRDSWFGFETEFFYANPHVKQQHLSTTNVPAGADFLGAHVRVSTLAFNVIAKYPGQRFQPYIGAGLGIFWARVSGVDFGTSADTSPGLNALAGVRFFLNERVGLFAEYKYNYTEFDFGRLGARGIFNSHYQPQHIVGGLALHF